MMPPASIGRNTVTGSAEPRKYPAHDAREQDTVEQRDGFARKPKG